MVRLGKGGVEARILQRERGRPTSAAARNGVWGWFQEEELGEVLCPCGEVWETS